MLYAIPFTDARERHHVVAVEADTPENALDLCIRYQTQNGPGYQGWYYNGFNRCPDLDDVVEIAPARLDQKHRELNPQDEPLPVQILWNEAYD